MSGITHTEERDATRFGTVFDAEITFHFSTFVCDAAMYPPGDHEDYVRSTMRGVLAHRIATEVESWLAGEGWKT